ncbi:hypothetical protein LCGC14_1429180 [marine sediment metagenome]|uniref:Uncharacterized protein n=1 Tax=marine sediment metagenome TaxID=412755 RepID=A0A0F9MQW7_9ZZZZ
MRSRKIDWKSKDLGGQMEKEFFKSMTFWGAVLLGLEGVLIVLQKDYAVIEPIVITS